MVLKAKLRKKKAKIPAGKRRLPPGKTVSCQKTEAIFLPRTRIKIIGIGGGGNSIVGELASSIHKADFLAANTDIRALQKAAKKCRTFIFGEAVTHQFGTGMDVKAGEAAAQKDIARIEKLFKNVDLAVLITCFGGGTGSGAVPIFAEAARKAGSLVLGIFTMPFKFEGEKKMLIAKESLGRAEPHLHGLILISNERIFRLVDKKTPLQDALSHINRILSHSLDSLIEVCTLPGLINIDFADLKTILRGKEKTAYLQSIVAEGEDRVDKIIQQIFQNPLYEYVIEKPQRILFNIAAGKDLKITEVERIARAIHERNPNAKIIFGISQQGIYERKVKITLLALGIKAAERTARKIMRVLKPAVRKDEISEDVPSGSKEESVSSQKTASKIKIGKEQKSGIKEKGEMAPASQSPAEKESGEKKEEVQDHFGKNGKPRKKSPTLRRHALDLKRDMKKAEKELLEKESKWDTPAFLRKKRKFDRSLLLQ